MNSDKFCLKWNDFESNLSVAFRELREEKDFFDVTLACEDSSQIEAHKVILSACSTFFKDILKKNPHQHPLLYLRGVKHSQLVNVLNFMYLGEVNVAQDDLNSFLSIAEELHVKGLTQGEASSKHKHPSKSNHVKHGEGGQSWGEPSKRATHRQEDQDIQEVTEVKSEPKESMLLAQDGESTQIVEEQDYDYEGYDDNILEPNTSYTNTDYDKGKILPREERPVITRVQVKKDLLKSLGNGKQCLLCNKLFSREKVAVEHVFDLHQDLLQSPACIIRKQGHLPAEDPKKSLKEMKKFKVSTEILDNTSPRAEVWKCKFCSEHFTALEETVGHLKKMHGVTRQDARNMSMIKIS